MNNDTLDLLCNKLFKSWRNLSFNVGDCCGFFQNSHVWMKQDGHLTLEQFDEMCTELETRIVDIKSNLDRLEDLSKAYNLRARKFLFQSQET